MTDDNVIDLSEHRRRRGDIRGYDWSWVTNLPPVSVSVPFPATCSEFVHYFGDPPSRCQCGEREWGHCD